MTNAFTFGNWSPHLAQVLFGDNFKTGGRKTKIPGAMNPNPLPTAS
jgi:hypothetical protein